MARPFAGDGVRARTLHRELKLGEVTFNPFNFKLTMRDAMIVERGKPLVGMRYLLADYQAASLFKRMHILREVTLDRPLRARDPALGRFD